MEPDILTATLTYDREFDALYAEGAYIGGAEMLTRDSMLARVGEAWSGDDQTLFDACVEYI